MSRRQLSGGSVSSLCERYGGNWGTWEASLGDRVAESSISSRASSSTKLAEVPEDKVGSKVDALDATSDSAITAGADGAGTGGTIARDASGVAPPSHRRSGPDSHGASQDTVAVITTADEACSVPSSRLPTSYGSITAPIVRSPPGSPRQSRDRERMPTPRRPSRLAEWTVDHVAKWVLSTPVPREVAARLQENAINGQVLESLTESDLLQMGVQKFGWRRQILLSRQELVQRLEERLKPPEGVDWIQIHSSAATPDKDAFGCRPRQNSSRSQTPPPSVRPGTMSAQSPRATPPSTSMSDCRSTTIAICNNGAGALPPPITRRIAFDPSFVPTPLSQAHTRRSAPPPSSLQASSPKMPGMRDSSLSTGGVRPTSPRPQRLARATSGLRIRSPPSTPKPSAPPAVIHTVMNGPTAAAPAMPLPPTVSRSSMPPMSSTHRLLIHSPSPRVRPEWSSSPECPVAAAVAAALGASSPCSTEQHQSSRAVRKGPGDRQSHGPTLELHKASSQPCVGTSACGSGGPPRLPISSPQRSQRLPANAPSFLPAPPVGTTVPPLPLRSLSPQKAPQIAGKLTSPPNTSPRNPSRAAGKDATVQHHSVLCLSHRLASPTVPTSARGRAKNGSFTAPPGLPVNHVTRKGGSLTATPGLPGTLLAGSATPLPPPAACAKEAPHC